VQLWKECPLSQLGQAETRAQVRACIDELPEPYRVVLVLRDIEELDTEQTAQRLGIFSGAVKVRLHRARQALRTLLEPIVCARSQKQ
jgi:RNA polymerase sigma-70 factor, ECF subfamily